MSEYGHDQEHQEHQEQWQSPPAEAPVPSKKRGPKPMTDEPTTRFEGQLFPTQYVDASAVVSRLKIENRSTPSAERRRMTINTLVRLGMTIVLENESALHGKSEAELLSALRQSLASRNGEHQG